MFRASADGGGAKTFNCHKATNAAITMIIIASAASILLFILYFPLFFFTIVTELFIRLS
jgi:hypothetical protein